MKFIRVTSYLKNEDYKESKIEGIVLKDQMDEVPALVNADDVIFVFPSRNGISQSMIRFRNGVSLDLKETVDELHVMLGVDKDKLH